jgi:hypothetical protein
LDLGIVIWDLFGQPAGGWWLGFGNYPAIKNFAFSFFLVVFCHGFRKNYDYTCGIIIINHAGIAYLSRERERELKFFLSRFIIGYIILPELIYPP